MTTLALVVWPFHAGLSDVGMGLGGSVLGADERLRSSLRAEGLGFTVERVAPVDESLPEIARIFELDRRLARQVADARRADRFPLVLGGNCISCLGTTAGVRGEQELGVVWLDAHADFDTPEDNLSGFTDVMGLSVLTGGCWRALRETIPHFSPVDESHVVLVGTRDLEDYQRDRVESSRLTVVAGAVDGHELTAALDVLRSRVQQVYLHIDLDVLDTSMGHANGFAADGGPGLATVLSAIDATFDRFDVRAAALTSYDPRMDGTGTIAAAARGICEQIARRS